MKNKVLIIISVILIIFLNGCTSLKYRQDLTLNNDVNEELIYEDIVDKIIRFHVIANSDSDDDQALKLKVRDKVIEFIYPYLKESQSLEESRNIILSNKDKMEELAKDVIKENNYSYSVTSSLSRENFPDKVYGELIFPQGEYEAYRIIIGEGKGTNWWCVMFPPLCFVDGTKESVDSNEIKKEIENSEENSNEENGKIEDEGEKGENQEKKVVFKFKIFDFLFKK